MKHYLKEIRRIMLASVRMDGAYYFFFKEDGNQGKHPESAVRFG